MKNFDYFGVMIDCSRGAVPGVSALKNFLDIIAKMGYNCAMLYIEDTYEIPTEPFFGYKRGKYTLSELSELDEYANGLGIELIPCVQTLAHLNAIFRWDCYKKNILDIDDIMIIGEERTYDLIEKMFKALSETLKTRKLHIGMDEAHHVGLGKFLDKNGFKNRYDILLYHLNRVCDIAKKYGYETLMWNDMFFRLVQNGDYRTDADVNFPAEVTEKIPENCKMVYWDYYAEKAEVYGAMIENSRKLSDNIWFAGGAWCWGGLTPHNKLSIRRNKIALPVCMEKGVKNVLLTMWGDDGTECSPFSVLPALMNAAAVAEGMNEEEMKEKFLEITGVSYDDALLLDTANYIYGDDFGIGSSNYSKNRLYNDPFLGIVDTNAEYPVDTAIFTEKAKKLRAAEKAAGKLAYLFGAQASLCEALAVKFDLGARTRAAYAHNDKAALRALAENDYSIFGEKLEAFYEAFRTQWYTANKPFGFEMHDTRLGGLMLRTKNCRRLLLDYCNGIIDKIPELEEEVLPHDGGNIGGWRNIITACPI